MDMRQTRNIFTFGTRENVTLMNVGLCSKYCVHIITDETSQTKRYQYVIQKR